ncbi:hypothetical protein O6H91_08G107100 [Diphasiastrum complanatum]|uniref:Uncharacterized protein n=1 Tax=Diphasiastrum complanatum TaxID=34168 RepID=A0ACC2D1Q8_DIPCM|nr:hypothetical protein O6H91_08G107100 [Diphasiastrum complanatum]
MVLLDIGTRALLIGAAIIVALLVIILTFLWLKCAKKYRHWRGDGKKLPSDAKHGGKASDQKDHSQDLEKGKNQPANLKKGKNYPATLEKAMDNPGTANYGNSAAYVSTIREKIREIEVTYS